MAGVYFDPILNQLRKRDISNAEISKISQRIDNAAGEATKDIEFVTNVADLNTIINPSTEKIYIVTGANQLYRYADGSFVLMNNTVVDDTLYVTSLDALDTIEIQRGIVTNVVVTNKKPKTYDIIYTGEHNSQHGAGPAQFAILQKYLPEGMTQLQYVDIDDRGESYEIFGMPEEEYNFLISTGNIMEIVAEHEERQILAAYTLTVTDSGDKILVGKEGYADLVNHKWIWTRYSVVGHRHDVSEIEGLEEKLNSIKQNLMVGTRAERLAFEAYEGLEWNETGTNESGTPQVIRYLYVNSQWEIIEAPQLSASENVALHISTYDGQGTLTGLSVGVTDHTTHESATYQLNASGNCEFSIMKGHDYTIAIASLSGYHDLPDQTFQASQDAKSINMTFLAETTQYEKVSFHVTSYNASMVNTLALQEELIGTVVTCQITGGDTLTAMVGENHCAEFEIPYGKEYHIETPHVAGFITIHAQSWTKVASLPQRTLPAHYLIWAGSDIMGMDEDGALYSYDTLDSMGQVAAKALIKALYLNDSVLQAQNAGFAYKVPLVTASKPWASSNVEFDTDLLPYKTNDSQASTDYNGPANTINIKEIGASLGITTGAATYCNEQILTVAGEDVYGYLGAYGEMKRLVSNLAQLTAFHLLLGYPAPQFNVGNWWTSTQGSATNAVTLYNGSFGNANKYGSTTVMALFRPFGN